MPLKYLARGVRGHVNAQPGAARGIVASCLGLGVRLYVTYDPDPDEALPSPLPRLLRAEDIFVAEAGLAPLLRAGDSPIEEYTVVRGSWEPFGGSGKKMHGVQYIKLLVRKVVTIYHALATGGGDECVSAKNAVVMWADEDVWLHSRPDWRLVDFARRHDIAYVPMQSTRHSQRYVASYNFSGEYPSLTRERGVMDDAWVIESGILLFRRSLRALALASAAVELYEGGMLRLVRRCAEAKKLPAVARASSCPDWIQRWLYPNDIYVWALLVRLAYNRSQAADELCCLGPARGLTQAWLPWHTSAQLLPAHNELTAPFRLDEYARHEMAGPVSRVTHLGSNATRPRDPLLYYKALNFSSYELAFGRDGGYGRVGRWPRFITRCGCTK